MATQIADLKQIKLQMDILLKYCICLIVGSRLIMYLVNVIFASLQMFSVVIVYRAICKAALH